MSKFASKAIAVVLTLAMLIPALNIPVAFAADVADSAPFSTVADSTEIFITNIHTDKAAYQPGTEAQITLEVTNVTDAPILESISLPTLPQPVSTEPHCPGMSVSPLPGRATAAALRKCLFLTVNG